MSTTPADNTKLTELRVSYWTKRLDHTLTHTQTSSQLIYLVDGAVLALLYFSLQTFGASKSVVLILSAPTMLLALLNLFHARLILIQHAWYSGIDAKLRKYLDQEPVEFTTQRRILSSTHQIYRRIHHLIAAFLALAAVFMFLYGQGYFHTLEFQKKAESFQYCSYTV